MKKHFVPVNPSLGEVIFEAAKEQRRECEMEFSIHEGTKWILDGFAYTTGQASAVLGIGCR